MHRLILQIDDSLLTKILSYLRTLPKEKIRIIEDDREEYSRRSIDFRQFDLPSLKKIDDPVSLQRAMRSEWD